MTSQRVAKRSCRASILLSLDSNYSGPSISSQLNYRSANTPLYLTEDQCMQWVVSSRPLRASLLIALALDIGCAKAFN